MKLTKIQSRNIKIKGEVYGSLIKANKHKEVTDTRETDQRPKVLLFLLFLRAIDSSEITTPWWLCDSLQFTHHESLITCSKEKLSVGEKMGKFSKKSPNCTPDIMTQNAMLAVACQI